MEGKRFSVVTKSPGLQMLAVAGLCGDGRRGLGRDGAGAAACCRLEKWVQVSGLAVAPWGLGASADCQGRAVAA